MADPLIALPGTSPAAAAGGRNMVLLVQLRWLAVFGQLVTILGARFAFDIDLPLGPMVAVVGMLALLNVATRLVLPRIQVTNLALLLALLLDVAALTAQLYLAGGATNPFISLYLLQVVLGAMLLETWSSWLLVAVTSIAFGLLALFHRPLGLPAPFDARLSPLHILGFWLNFVLAAMLLVQFVTRITQNLRMRDARLADLRQRAAEEDHIVRMGLLASGAAHELGTPLASLSVILGDWKQHAGLGDPQIQEEIAEMQGAVQRCKAIVRGILQSSGEVMGEAPVRTTLRAFVRALAEDWSALHPGFLHLDETLESDPPIVADRALSQALSNVLDNALEAGATAITLSATIRQKALRLRIADNGTGFPQSILNAIGTPYRSTKGEDGRGLGLFLALNVLRTLGGTVSARNRVSQGAEVTLTLPLAALAIGTLDD